MIVIAATLVALLVFSARIRRGRFTATPGAVVAARGARVTEWSCPRAMGPAPPAMEVVVKKVLGYERDEKKGSSRSRLAAPYKNSVGSCSLPRRGSQRYGNSSRTYPRLQAVTLTERGTRVSRGGALLAGQGLHLRSAGNAPWRGLSFELS